MLQKISDVKELINNYKEGDDIISKLTEMKSKYLTQTDELEKILGSEDDDSTKSNKIMALYE